MQIFTGIDIIEMGRFRTAHNFERLAEFILNPAEIRLMDASRDRCQFLASRFAVKEAVIKALPNPATLADLEVASAGPKLEVRLKNSRLTGCQISASLTHSEFFAAAVAVVLIKS